MELAILFVLSIVNGVFSMSEAAVIVSRKARLQQRADDGDAGAKIALTLADNPNRFLSTVQIGITLIGQVSGAFAGATIAQDIARYLREIDSPFAPYGEAIGFALIVLLTTYLSLIIGELVPKRLALQYPERIASAIAGPMRVLSQITAPIVWFLGASTDLVLRLIGVKPSDAPPVTEEEIKAMVQQGVDAGVFEQSDHTMIQGIFRLDNRRVSQLMTPRTEVVWLDMRDSDEENQAKIVTSHFSRFPVCEGDLDHVIGVISAKDMLARVFAGNAFDLRTAMKEAVFVPESVYASDLLERFRETGKHSALVIGEYGGLEGMITIQDILEDIVGDIEDPDVTKRDDGSYLIDGMIPIDDFKALIDVDSIPGENQEFETLAGFVLTQKGSIPKAGDSFEWLSYRFEVMDMDGNRVDKVLVTRIPTGDANDKQNDAG